MKKYIVVKESISGEDEVNVFDQGEKIGENYRSAYGFFKGFKIHTDKGERLFLAEIIESHETDTKE